MGSKILLRPSSLVLLGVVICSLALSVSGTPVPDSETKRQIEESFNDATDKAKSFFERAKNTFTGEAGIDDKNGLTHWELVGIIAAAVVLLLILPCCICYCICECVQELLCCIFCCSWCRD